MLDSNADPVETTATASDDTAARTSEASCLELEREIVAVARTVHSARVRFACPVCDDPMELHEVVALDEFGSLDIKLHQLGCGTCGMIASRMYHPSVGYSPQTTR